MLSCVAVQRPGGEPVWRQVLREHLRHRNPAVAQQAATALAEFSEQSCVPDSADIAVASSGFKLSQCWEARWFSGIMQRNQHRLLWCAALWACCVAVWWCVL
jgi:hypothetical protein